MSSPASIPDSELEAAALNAEIEWRQHRKACAICRAFSDRPARVSAPCWLGRELIRALDSSYRARRHARLPALSS